MRYLTAEALIKRIQRVCKKNGLDPKVAPIRFPTPCGGHKLVEVYAGGDTQAESVVIRLGRDGW